MRIFPKKQHVILDFIEAHQQGVFDDACEREVWRAIARVRAERIYRLWLAMFTSAWQFIKAARHIIRSAEDGQHRRSTAQIHGGPDPTSGASPGAFSAGGTGAIASVPGGTITFASVPGGTITFASTFTGTNSGLTQSTPPLSIEDGGIKAGEITGYRCWLLGPDDLLYSVVQIGFVWSPKEIIDWGPHQHGIYAYKSVLSLSEYGTPDSTSVTGQVDLWGDVVEHEHGYRAQYAAISWIDDSPYYDAKALRKKYGIKERRAARKKK